MERYIVVACLKCGRVTGVDRTHKTFKCSICGHVNTIRQLNIFSGTADISELPALVAAVQTGKHGGREQYLADVQEHRERNASMPTHREGGSAVEQLDLRRVRTVINRPSRLEEGIALLGRDGVTFTEEDIISLMKALELDEMMLDPDRWVGILLKKDIIYEPKAGRYALLL